MQQPKVTLCAAPFINGNQLIETFATVRRNLKQGIANFSLIYTNLQQASSKVLPRMADRNSFQCCFQVRSILC